VRAKTSPEKRGTPFGPLKCFPTSPYRPPAPAQVSGCAAVRLDATSSLIPPPPSRGRDFEDRTLTSACDPFGVRSAQGRSPEGGTGPVEGLDSFPRLWDRDPSESTWPKAPHGGGPLAMQASPCPPPTQDLYKFWPGPCATVTYQISSLIRCV